MEPKYDPDLHNLLQEWRAPALPLSLEDRVLGQRGSWWRFLWRGSIRVPVPVVCCLVILMTAAAWRMAKPGASAGTCSAAGIDRRDISTPPALPAPKKDKFAPCLSGSSC